MESHEITNSRALKPAYSIPLDFVTEIGDLTAEEQSKFKKHFAQGFGVFKVVFDSTKLIKGLYMRIALSEHEGDDKENHNKPRMDKLETWFFSTGQKLNDTTEGVSRDDWMRFLAKFVTERNPSVILAESVKAVLLKTETPQVEAFNSIPTMKHALL